MLKGILTAGNLLVLQHFLDMGTRHLESGHAIDHVNRDAKAIDLVGHRQIQRRVDVAFFFVATHMDVVMVGPPVGEAVDQPGIAVKVKDYRLIEGE